MNIRVDLNTDIADGSEVVFRSPADCSQVTGLVIYHKHGKTEFAFADAHGNNVGDIDHLFAENAVVKVILDVASSMAFVQNADTNAYIERTFVKSVNGQAPDEKGNVEVEIEIPEAIPAGGDHDMEVSFDVVRANQMTSPEFVIADSENPFGSIIFTKEGAEEDEEPRKAVMLTDPAGNPVVMSNVANPEKETDVANKKFVEEQTEELGKYLEDLVFAETIQVYGAEVGQILKVEAVDEDGHPTAWETVTPSAVPFRLIRQVVIPEDITTDTSGVNFVEAEKGGILFGFDTDKDGNPFCLNEFYLDINAGTPASSTAPFAFSSKAIPGYNNGSGLGINIKLAANNAKSRATFLFLNKAVLYCSGTYAANAVFDRADFSYLEGIKGFSCYVHGNVSLGFSAGSTFTLYGR